MPILLPVTLSTAAGAALLTLWLGVRIVGLRRRHGVAFGDGGHPQLLARMRAQANFTEYTTPFVLLVLLVELARGASAWLWTAALAFLLFRVVHAFGMDRPAPNALRIAGQVGTWTLLGGLALYAIWVASAG